MSHIGTTKIGKMYLGTTEMAKAYLGTQLVFQNARQFLTFASTSSNTLSLICVGTAAPTLYYSTDASHWTIWDYSALTITNNAPIYIYGNNPSGLGTDTSNYIQFKMEGDGNVSCTGNLNSLIDGTTTTVPSTYCFAYLFYNCGKLVSAPSIPFTTLKTGCYRSMFYSTGITQAPELPAESLQNDCYYSMFQKCASLTEAPELPATTLKQYCYYNMFNGCTSLATPPELPATTLATYCYYNMFYGCTALETAPELKATTLQNHCYRSMFQGCTKLRTAPKLPALTLVNSCYYQMFYGCSSLVMAPDLPATTLVTNCYYSMFHSCSKLAYVRALFTTTPSDSYTYYWLRNVASIGTFVKSSSATWTTTGENAVPTGWTTTVDMQYDAQVEYLQSTGTQFINLPAAADTGMYFEVSGNIIPVYTNSNKYNVFGANPYQQLNMKFYSGSSTSITYSSSVGNVSSNGGIGASVGTKHYILLSTTKKVVDQNETALSRPLSANITGFRLFGGYDNGNRYPVKICDFKIVVGNDTIFDLIPVRVGQVGYMYDKITKTLFPNSGTGNFTLGADI